MKRWQAMGVWCVAGLAMAMGAAAAEPAPLDMDAANAEVGARYAAAHPEVREYVLHTARSFGRSGLWLNEDAWAHLSDEQREEKVVYLAELLEGAEYGRHLCYGLAHASALKDPRLVPGLMEVAGFHRDDRDYDCRPKWMAVAALARQGSDDAVPLLVSLVDHGNQNTRFWARAALSRHTGEDFGADKPAWAAWWEAQGHEAIPAEMLEPWTPPAEE
ncbi:MAG: HEAT repeat domain-containing protein [Planctomycetota bacterium]